MTGTVGTTIVIKGKKIRLEQTYDDNDYTSFQLALKEVNKQTRTGTRRSKTDIGSARPL